MYEYDEDEESFLPIEFAKLSDFSSFSSSSYYSLLKLKSASIVIIMWKFIGFDGETQILPCSSILNNFNSILDIQYKGEPTNGSESNKLIEKRMQFSEYK